MRMHNHWTEADLVDRTQNGNRYEITDGRLYVTLPEGGVASGSSGCAVCVAT